MQKSNSNLKNLFDEEVIKAKNYKNLLDEYTKTNYTLKDQVRKLTND